MNPIVSEEAGDAPEHAQWLDCTRRLGLAHVCRFPAELIEDSAHDFLRSIVVAADEHRRLATLELRIHHARTADGIEGFDEVYIGKLTLQPLHQGFVEIREKLQYAVD